MPYTLLRAILRTVSRLPFSVLYLLSDVLALVVYHVVRYRRKLVRKNLVSSFPHKTKAEVVSIEKKFYRFFTDNFVESLKTLSISPDEMSRRMKFVNIEEVNSQLRQGHNVALFLGHYANWEWISSMPLHLAKEAVPAQIYRKLRNKTVDRLMLEMRSRMDAVCVEMHRTARFITHELAEGHVCIVGFIADQSPRFRELNHYLPFLHHSVPVLIGTEKIARHYDFEPRFVHVRKVRRGYYEAEFVKMCDNPKELPELELTAIYYRMLEEMILSAPELYLWSHNRFKYARPEQGSSSE